jgi:hypothetical protein
MKKLIKPKLDFRKSGYYFIGLFVLVLLGFWPSYFSKFIDGTADFNFYFHFHAVIATLWLILLVAQPILIRKKKLLLHRSLGKLSYVLVPLIFISVMLLAHNRITGNEEDLGLSLWVPFKDLLVLGVAYFIAIRYRHSIQIHARGMIAAGIVLIEPALVRLILYTFFPESGFAPEGYLATIIIVYLLLIGLIIAERKQNKGRWVFPLIFGLYIFVHSVLVFQIQIEPWQALAKWFASLPLT